MVSQTLLSGATMGLLAFSTWAWLLILILVPVSGLARVDLWRGDHALQQLPGPRVAQLGFDNGHGAVGLS